MTAIINILQHDAFSFGAGFAVFASIIYGLMKLSAFIAVWKDRDYSFKEIRNSIFSMKADIKIISKAIIVIETKQDNIEERQNNMEAKQNSFISSRADAISATKSPIALNDKGEKIAKEIDASRIIENSFDGLKEKIEAEDPKNAYDIQQLAFNYSSDILEHLDENTLNQVKEIAFNESVTMFEIAKILGILSRDKILEERNMIHSDVDKHDPSAKPDDL